MKQRSAKFSRYFVFLLAYSFISIHIQVPETLTFIMPDEDNATLKKKSQELREQVNALSEEIRKLKKHITEYILGFRNAVHDQQSGFAVLQ